jgi:hypothetical protein
VKSLWFSTLKPACLNWMYVSNLDLDLRKVDQKYLEGFGMWCWRKMKKICRNDRVKNEEALRIVKEGINILHTIQGRKVNWTGHSLPRSCLLNHVIEGKIEWRIEVTGRWGRRHEQLLDDLKERRGCCKFKDEALDRILWRTRFWRDYGPVVRDYRLNESDFRITNRLICLRIKSEWSCNK